MCYPSCTRACAPAGGAPVLAAIEPRRCPPSKPSAGRVVGLGGSPSIAGLVLSISERGQPCEQLWRGLGDRWPGGAIHSDAPSRLLCNVTLGEGGHHGCVLRYASWKGRFLLVVKRRGANDWEQSSALAVLGWLTISECLEQRLPLQAMLLLFLAADKGVLGGPESVCPRRPQP